MKTKGGGVPCVKGKSLFDTAGAASLDDYALLYADYLEHVASCDICIKQLAMSDYLIQEAKESAKGFRRGVALRTPMTSKNGV